MDSDRALHPHSQCLEIKMLYNGERSCSSGEKNDIKKVSFYREGMNVGLGVGDGRAVKRSTWLGILLVFLEVT